MGKFIHEEIILSRTTGQGGSTTEVLGPQGTGKTSFMLNYAKLIMDRNPDEIVIWKDSYESQAQFNRLQNFQIFVEDGVNLQFKDIYRNEIIEIEKTTFTNYNDLIKKMLPQQLNVVYVKDEVIGYIKLLNFLRRAKGWQSVFIDEYKDIASLNETGIRYRLIGALGKEMSTIRKGLVSVFCNTQSKSQIDWRVRSAFMCYVYLSGAKKDKHTSLYQNAINSLAKGKAWISWEGKFGRVKFPPYPPKDPVLDVVDLNRQSQIDFILSDNEM